MALSALLVLPAVCLEVGRFAVGQTVLRLPSHACPRVLSLYPSPTCRTRGARGYRPAWFRTMGGVICTLGVVAEGLLWTVTT